MGKRVVLINDLIGHINGDAPLTEVIGEGRLEVGHVFCFCYPCGTLISFLTVKLDYVAASNVMNYMARVSQQHHCILYSPKQHLAHFSNVALFISMF